jgi:PEP-CTERM motif
MKRSLIKVLSVVLTFGALLVAPRASEAASVTINSLSVTVGGVTWCISGCAAVGANGPIWSGAAGAVVHSPSEGGTQVLILTQTAIGNQFNFDSSDRGGTGGDCAPATPCVTSLTINGVVIALSGTQLNALANFNLDDGSITHQETSEWGPAVFNGGPGGLVVWFGYADTAHNSACTDAGANCLPDNPWQGSANTQFVGNTVTTPAGQGCDKPGITACFDAGAIRIQVNDIPVTTPEPSVLVMLGVGLVGIAVVTRKRAKNNA